MAKKIYYEPGAMLGDITLIHEIAPYISPKGRRLRRGLFKCVCGKLWEVNISDVVRGHTKSCGCLPNIGNTKHNGKHHPLYTHWKAMRQRCNGKNTTKYPRYGGRGITICSEWDNYENFKDWSLSNGWEKGLSIDRIDNDGNYEPNNCRWVSIGENVRYKPASKMNWEKVNLARNLKKQNPTLTNADLAKQFGISYSNMSKIINHTAWVR